MSAYFAFGQDDIVRNVIKSNPSVEFYIYQNEIFHNNRPHMSGAFTGSVLNVPPGHINLYEYKYITINKSSKQINPTSNQPIDQSINQPINQSINPSIHEKYK